MNSQSRQGDLLAVVSQSGPTLTFFDAETHERVDILALPPEPHELCHDPDNGVLYCAITYRGGYYHAHQGREHHIAVVDVAGRRVVDLIDTAPDHAPHGLALDRARGLLYASVEATEDAPGGALVIDTRTRKVVGRIPTMAPGPHWFAVTPDGKRGYATNKEAPYVSVADLETGEFLRRIEVPGSEGLSVSPDGKYVYVAAPKADFEAATDANRGIRVIDTATDEIVRVLPTEGVVVPVHTTATGLILAGELRLTPVPGSQLGEQTNGVLTVFDPVTSEVRGQVPVGKSPLTITSSPDGSLAYVACVVSSTVTVVDLDRMEVRTELHVDHADVAGAHGLAYLPR